MVTRKNFIGGILASGVAPVLVPNSVFGANAPSSRITVGGIGIGGIGNAQLPQIREAGFEVVALCDLDWKYAERVFKKFPQARKFKDFREMLRVEADRIDAVYCGCPDHWHALVTLAALAKKKHVCCVKPLTRSVEEVRAVVKAARAAGTATQVTACTSNDEASVRLYEYLAAGLIGFLCYNFHPAKVFMGDTGSLFLGGMFCAVAYGLRLPILIPLVGIIYLCEAGSVILQRYYFKLTHGKRIFKMSPIHHHFEMSGWSEVKIVSVFSLVTIIAGIISVVLVVLGVR